MAATDADKTAVVEAAQDSRGFSSEPPRTYRGPDGLPHMIVYDLKQRPDDRDPVQVRAAVLSDMQHHPRNIAKAYDMDLAEIAEIVAGQRPFPEKMLPQATASEAAPVVR